MGKLFSLENNIKLDDGDNKLLIDKVLEYGKKEESPISLTADVVKQRQELKADITKQLNKDTDNEDTIDTSSDNNTNKESDDNDVGTDKESNNNNETEQSTSDTKTENELDDKDDVSASADDKDSLKSIIGSGHNAADNKNTPEHKEYISNKEAKEATESYKPKLTPNNIFSAIHSCYNMYRLSMESFNIRKLSIEDQPIVYVKESVLEGLNNLINIANTYISKNKTYIDNNTATTKTINERLTVLGQFIQNRKYHFTNKLISDQDLLTNVSIVDKSDIYDTSKYITGYCLEISKLVNFILTNTFENISSGLTNSNFIKEGEDYIYKDMIPGFNTIRVHLDSYENYLKANIDNFHYYKVKVFKTENLYKLEAVTISEDKKLDYILSNLDKLLIELSMTVDNFNIVNTNLNKLIDEVKVVIYDVENNKYDNLANIDIDGKVKDFIKFKLVSEIYYTDITLFSDYILSVLNIIDKCVELKM